MGLEGGLPLPLDHQASRAVAHPAADRRDGQSRLPLLRQSPRHALQLRFPLRGGRGGLMRLTLIHPAIGHRMGERPDRSDYIRTWQMEPLPMAALAAPTPADVDIRFHDDRAEPIPF